MKLIRSFCLLLMTGSAFANQTIMVDPHFSPYSGSANLIFAQDLIIQGEDALFTKSSRDTTTKVWGRTFEQLLFCTPL